MHVKYYRQLQMKVGTNYWK